MTEYEGRGVQSLVQLANAALSALPRSQARSIIDSLDDGDLAMAIDAASGAGVAVGGDGNLFYESAALRLHRPRAFPQLLTDTERLELQGLGRGERMRKLEEISKTHARKAARR